ncbi:MAG: hypothetical protein ACE5JF_04390 [Anaerolineales bacterium]
MIIDRAIRQSYWAALAFFLLFGACSPVENPVKEQATPFLEGTVQAQVEQTVSAIFDSETVEPSTTPSATPTAKPIVTLTSTMGPVFISVSAPTNCRIGPGYRFQRTGTLLVEATAEVAAKSSLPNFWYISTPDRPG